MGEFKRIYSFSSTRISGSRSLANVSASAALPCVCRMSKEKPDEGAGEDYEDMCIAVGDMARYCVEIGRGHYIDYDQATLTEEQVKLETSRCLGCGASVVDPNKCIGCGVRTTRCHFDAIHLFRERPECSNLVTREDSMKVMLPYMAKRAAKNAIKELKQKIGK